jgi:hypothetical protein
MISLNFLCSAAFMYALEMKRVSENTSRSSDSHSHHSNYKVTPYKCQLHHKIFPSYIFQSSNTTLVPSAAV